VLLIFTPPTRRSFPTHGGAVRDGVRRSKWRAFGVVNDSEQLVCTAWHLLPPRIISPPLASTNSVKTPLRRSAPLSQALKAVIGIYLRAVLSSGGAVVSIEPINQLFWKLNALFSIYFVFTVLICVGKYLILWVLALAQGLANLLRPSHGTLSCLVEFFKNERPQHIFGKIGSRLLFVSLVQISNSHHCLTVACFWTRNAGPKKPLVVLFTRATLC